MAASPASARAAPMPSGRASTRSPRAWAASCRSPACRGRGRCGSASRSTICRAGILLAQAILMALIEREQHRRRAVGPHLAARGADLHARFPGVALAEGRRGGETGRQRPSDRHPDRPLPDRGRPHQHRRLRRPLWPPLLRGGRRDAPARQPGLQHRRGALEEPQGAERDSSPRSPGSARAPIGSS